MWHSVGSLVEDAGIHRGTPLGNDAGPNGQDVNDNRAYRSRDALSVVPNQGSAYVPSSVELNQYGGLTE
jgi:hypothetical protein